MDPAMNSAVEEQAIDRWVYFDRHLGLSQKHPSIFVRPSRIHRIGQTKQVFVKRLIIKDSIEERILETRRSLAADGPKTSTHLDGTPSWGSWLHGREVLPTAPYAGIAIWIFYQHKCDQGMTQLSSLNSLSQWFAYHNYYQLSFRVNIYLTSQSWHFHMHSYHYQTSLHQLTIDLKPPTPTYLIK